MSQEKQFIHLRPPESKGELDQNERIKENIKDIDYETMTFDEFDEMFEDRDPFEFM